MQIFKNNNHLLVPYLRHPTHPHLAWCYIFFDKEGESITLKEVSQRPANIASLKEVTNEYTILVYTEGDLSIQLEKLSEL